jgi:adenylate cyclase
MKSLGTALLAGLLLAIASTCFYFTQYGQNIEESFGLALLFKLRGPRESPTNVVIINIDDTSSDQLTPSLHFSKWPRTIHAALVNRLKVYGAKVIAFDIFFSEDKDYQQDLIFAEAIRHAGNVILAEEMRHKSIMVPGYPNQLSTVEVDTLVPPIKPLADAALALAPFPLPKIPVRVDTTWRFKGSCGNTPTLPSTVFQAANLSLYEQLYTLLLDNVPNDIKILPDTVQEATATLGLVETIHNIREIFLQNSWLNKNLVTQKSRVTTAELSSEARQNLLALIAMYEGESNVGIDFYGPPASLTTLSYMDILSPDEDPVGPIASQIRDKVVFIGVARKTWSNQKDGFFTVFSQPDGLDLSGVELAATVFANLSENRQVHQPSTGATIAIIFVCAVVTCLISFLLTPPFAALLLLGGIIGYLVGAHIAFSQDAVWTPLIIPLTFLPFAGFLGANLTNYLSTYRERRNARKALGFYLPNNVVAKLSRDLSFINKGDEKVYSTCLITDAQHYTSLSESMAPEDLSTHMKEYYQYLFREVKKMDGLVCNIIGDSMLALWPSTQPEALLRAKGCQAALQIAKAVKIFNGKHKTRPLPTRIGLHCGYLLMDNIGAEDHFEYAPIGDIVNTVSRIEGLNKRLGTQILASEEVLQGVVDIETREVGLFLLNGKTKPVTIYQLLAGKKQSENWNRLVRDAFPDALILFQTGQWKKALAGFVLCLSLDAKDGPSLFYKQLCESSLQKSPSVDWQGVVQVDK